jgi:CRP-like cAMP-binding protein
MTLKEELKKSILFKDLTDDEIDKLLPLCEVVDFPSGTDVYSEGDFAEKFYIVRKGKVLLDLKNTMAPYDPPGRMIVDMVSPGEGMGWSALVEPYHYTLSGKCAESTSLIAVNGPGLLELMTRECHMGLNIMKAVAKVIANRLNHTRVLIVGERGLHAINHY